MENTENQTFERTVPHKGCFFSKDSCFPEGEETICSLCYCLSDKMLAVKAKHHPELLKNDIPQRQEEIIEELKEALSEEVANVHTALLTVSVAREKAGKLARRASLLAAVQATPPPQTVEGVQKAMTNKFVTWVTTKGSVTAVKPEPVLASPGHTPFAGGGAGKKAENTTKVVKSAQPIKVLKPKKISEQPAKLPSRVFKPQKLDAAFETVEHN